MRLPIVRVLCSLVEHVARTAEPPRSHQDTHSSLLIQSFIVHSSQHPMARSRARAVGSLQKLAMVTRRQIRIAQQQQISINNSSDRRLELTTYPNNRAHLFIVLIAMLWFANAPTSFNAVCPKADDIKPCTCDDEGLQCLKLNDSGLARVFSASAERKAIRRVWIFQTNLTVLPARSFGDYIIRDLYLDLNQITYVVSGAFGEASKTLHSLSLTRNLLVEFPFQDLAQMKQLRQLGFGYNRLQVITSDAFPPSDLLESLDLSHNQIDSIQPGAFDRLYEVSLIDLSRNNLKSIESNALSVKSSQRHLAISLRGNQIDKIAVDAFGNNYHPYSLDLSRNQLTYLDQLVFEPLLLNDTTVHVEDNPFTCSGCHLYRWLVELNRAATVNLINFACPDETRLEDLTLEIIGCNENGNS